MRALLVLVALFGLAACSGGGSPASGVYNAASGETSYTSRPVRLGSPRSGGMSGARDLALRATASCTGQGCSPQAVILSASNVGQQELRGDFTDLEIQTDHYRYAWDAESDDLVRVPNLYGDFLRVPLPMRAFADIAHAETVYVRIGAREYILTPGRRSAFMDLLVAMGDLAPPPPPEGEDEFDDRP